MTIPTDQEIQATVISLVKNKTTYQVTTRSLLNQDLNFDYLDKVELVFELETTYDISVPDEDVEEWISVDDVWRSVLGLIKAKTA